MDPSSSTPDTAGEPRHAAAPSGPPRPAQHDPRHRPGGQRTRWTARLTRLALMQLARGITGVRCFWQGCAPEPGQRVYFANHASHTDFLLLWASLPAALRATTRPVAGADYWHRSPLRRFIIDEVFNGVLVERSAPGGTVHPVRPAADAMSSSAPDDVSSSPDDAAVLTPAADGSLPRAPASWEEHPPSPALRPLHDALSQGDSLIIFPEGTRHTGDGLLPFKSGLYHLRRDFPEVAFVPVWLENLHRVMPKGQLLPLPLLCTVTFGEPLWLHEGESKADFLARARQALLDLNPRPER